MNELIKNKTMAIILAILTFIVSSVSLVNIIFYFLGYPLSSIWEHQLYVFFAVLVGAVLASMVYGRGSKERASQVAKILNELLGLEIEEKVVWKFLHTMEQIPPVVVNKYVYLNINIVEEFDNKIGEYKSQMTDEDLVKIGKIIEKPIPELQSLLERLYLETDLEQFKILADPRAEQLIALNLREIKRVLFDD